MNIDEIIDSIYQLPEPSRAALKETITEVVYPKGHLLFTSNKIVSTVYFIKKGIARAYSDASEHEITFWIGKEGDTILSMKYYVSNEKGYENVELLEECVLYQLEGARLSELYKTDIHIATWGRKFAERELVKTEQRLISRLCKTSLERYTELMRESPELLQRVQLGYLASYLGMTPVSLSRVRAKIR